MTCCGEVIKNQVAGKEFYFCRGCKKEVEENLYEFTCSEFGQIVSPTGLLARLPNAPATKSLFVRSVDTEKGEVNLTSGPPGGWNPTHESYPVPELELEDWIITGQVIQVNRHEGTVTLRLRDIKDCKKLEVGLNLDIQQEILT